MEAHGGRIEGAGATRATVTAMTPDGKKVEVEEEIARGQVSHPILCMGKFLRRGWNVSSRGHEIIRLSPAAQHNGVQGMRGNTILENVQQPKVLVLEACLCRELRAFGKNSRMAPNSRWLGCVR